MCGGKIIDWKKTFTVISFLELTTWLDVMTIYQYIIFNIDVVIYKNLYNSMCNIIIVRTTYNLISPK